MPGGARRVALIAATIGAASISVWSQQPAAPAASGDLVQFSVTVLDKNHHPVSGLTQADFAVFEDGKSRPIASFHAVSADEAVALASAAATPQAAWTREVQPDVATNALPLGRLFVLVVDDALVPRWPKITANVKRIGLDLIDHLGSSDQMAVLIDVRAARARLHERSRLAPGGRERRNSRRRQLESWLLRCRLRRRQQLVSTVATVRR